ncbi:hypothetical protein K2O51_33000 (plasmid) [Cupriavidus pinatubonensis]|uniref:hypothetical protein n=1 Tax=Cupriavidus pinatubonensis TaxID=248026 RepID=UPI001C72FC3E|nr:hypothetical protein [Cupriavidus pinatubonensis]QYY34177.1 hypothetical protein K2O51_33000 [Cupriavidus pinatubonensis]
MKAATNLQVCRTAANPLISDIEILKFLFPEGLVKVAAELKRDVRIELRLATNAIDDAF